MANSVNDGFKQRLAGAAILVLAAVILIPVFFDGAGYKERHLESSIPEPAIVPQMVEIETENQQLPDTTVAAEPAAPVTVVEIPVEIAEAVEQHKPVIVQQDDPPALDKQGVPVAWSLQLASFKDEDNARGLRRKLIEAGYQVYTRKNGDLIKVLFGPDMQKTRLSQLQGSIQEEFGLDGIIVRFTTR